MLYKRTFRKEKEVATFLIKALNLNLPVLSQLLAWQAVMLIGEIDKAFVSSVCYPVTDLHKHRRQDLAEHCGKDRRGSLSY